MRFAERIIGSFSRNLLRQGRRRVSIRNAIADDQVSGFRIPGGSALMMSPWLTHLDALYWENPESFARNDSRRNEAVTARNTRIIPSVAVRGCVLAIVFQ